MKKYKYIEWFDAGEMHEHSKEWFSELSFIKHEQQFLDNLIQSFAIRPMDNKTFGHIKEFKNAIVVHQDQLNVLFKQIQKHMNQLEIVTDDVDQLEMEQAYRITHKKLLNKLNEYLVNYRTAKEKGYKKLAAILREHKKLSLGNPEYKLRTSKS